MGVAESWPLSASPARRQKEKIRKQVHFPSACRMGDVTVRSLDTPAADNQVAQAGIPSELWPQLYAAYSYARSIRPREAPTGEATVSYCSSSSSPWRDAGRQVCGVSYTVEGQGSSVQCVIHSWRSGVKCVVCHTQLKVRGQVCGVSYTVEGQGSSRY